MALTGQIGVNPTIVDTTAKTYLLDRARVKGKGEFVYIQANGALAQYDWVKIDNDGQAYGITTALSGAEPTAIGIAQVAIASGSYGWVWVGCGGGLGKGVKGTVLASCAADAKIGTTTTAGALDDTYTDLVQGVCLVTANGGSTAAVEVWASGYMYTNAQD